jgi:hypothetical protein
LSWQLLVFSLDELHVKQLAFFIPEEFTNAFGFLHFSHFQLGSLSMNRVFLLATLGVLMSIGTTATALDPTKIESPQYLRWVKFKPGTTVRIESKTINPEKTIEQTTIYKLVEVNEKQVVVEMSVEVRNGASKEFNPGQIFTHKRWFELPKGVTKESLAKPRGILEEGKEKLTAAGREFDTYWHKTKTRVEAGDSFFKVWYSDTAPGGIVKEENETPNAKSKTTRDLVEIVEPK